MMLGEGDVLVYITITTHLFSSILGLEEGPHPTLALSPLFVMIQPLVIEILPVFIVLGEDVILAPLFYSTTSSNINYVLLIQIIYLEIFISMKFEMGQLWEEYGLIGDVVVIIHLFSWEPLQCHSQPVITGQWQSTTWQYLLI